ncbi:MAG: adenine phosphoribosyltransferase [Candidatus Krumholzibacteriota bacterium]|nr:adenine phosphoribosyltransferase [Candidatus Krumholzibacteriota bacterium]
MILGFDLKKYIRDIPDFPEKGILFRDITPALESPEAFGWICDTLAKRYSGYGIDKIAGIEARGFLFGSVLAYKLSKGFIPVRKPGKLPGETISESYSLEYGKATLEIQIDAVSAGEKILIVDDLLATGGTAAAAAKLLGNAGGRVIEILSIIELTDLKGREALSGIPLYSLISY